MDTPRDPAFDSIVFTAAQLFRVPMAAMAFIGPDRVWAKAAVGALAQEYARNQAFCSYLVTTRDVLIVEDMAADDRFSQFTAAPDAPPIRFCASAPIFGPNSQVVGALCVLDRHPRSVPDRQLIQLIQLARDADELLRLRIQASRPYLG